MFRLVSPILVALAMSSAVSATDAPNLPKHLINLSSHSAEFFEDLLTGRVWVHERHGAPAAMYFGPDGEFRNCSLRADKSGYRFSGPGWTWRIGTRDNSTALQVSIHPSGRRVGMVIVYTAESGRFHAEQYFGRTRDWRIVHDGWIQDTLPAVIRDNCPNLRTLVDLRVDRSQTQHEWPEFIRAAAPIRNHPGHEYGYIGATGLAASAGLPTLTAEQLPAIGRRLHGVIGITPRGRRLVILQTPHRREIWLVDGHDDLIDVGIVTPVPHRHVNVVRWQGSTPDYSFRTRYPVPIRPTPRRHPAFRMTTDFAASARPVTLDHPAVGAAAFVFASGGKATSGRISGTWWISGGDIKLRVDGKVRAYPWREFARAAGWTPPHPPAPSPQEFEVGGD